MRKTKVFLLAFAMFAVVPIMAQTDDSKPTLELSLEEAKTYALENNIRLQNAGLDVKIANAKRWQTIATMLPQVNAKLDYQNMFGYNMDLGGMALSMPPTGTFGITAAVALSGAQIVGTLLNDVAVDMSNITVQKTESELGHNTTSMYMSILAMDQTIDLLNKNLANMQELYRITQNSVDVGVSEQTAADQISVQVSSMESVINSADRNREMLYNSLALQLGCGVEVSIVLTQKLDDLLSVEAAMKLLFTEFDLEKNYDYQLLKKNTELSKKQIVMSAMDYIPTITAVYQYSGKKYFSNEPTLNMTPPNLFALSLNVPIWSSGQRAAAVTEKKIAHESAINTMKDTEDVLMVQNKQLRYNLTNAYENYNTQKKNIDVSLRIFETTTDKFEQGYSSNVELTNASTTLLTAQNNYVQSVLEIVNAHIALKQLLNQ